jgi:phosphonate transport system substrate-binding protein
MRITRRRCAANVWLATLLLFLAVTVRGAEPGRPYEFGVFPHLATARLEQIFAPVAAQFQSALHGDVLLRTRPSFEAFMEELDRGRYDIALVQPFDYLRIHALHGYIAVARRGEPLSAVIMVMPDSSAVRLSDLRGAVIGLPPAVAAVSHLTRIALKQHGIDPGTDVTLRYHRSHDSCLQQLLIGAVAACGTAANPVRFFESKMSVRFRLLATSPGIPHALFVVHPRIPQAAREAIRANILSWPDTEQGRHILATGKFKPFVPCTDADYDIVRRYQAMVDQPGGTQQ